MPAVTFLPSGATLRVPPGTLLVEAARMADVGVVVDCGGEGTCGKCAVRIAEGEIEAGRTDALSSDALARGVVLACQASVLNGDVTIEVLAAEPSVAVPAAGGCGSEEGRSVLPEGRTVDPPVTVWTGTLPPAAPDDGLSDMERVIRAIDNRRRERAIRPGLAAVRAVSSAVRDAGGALTATIFREGEELHLLRVEAGARTGPVLGLAVDLGTTTVWIRLVDLRTGRVAVTEGDYNGQISCGMDVISRINYARLRERREELRRRVLDTIRGLLQKACSRIQAECGDIVSAVVSGNTTMAHLLLGLNPEHLRLAPYTPAVLEVPFLRSADVELGISPEAPVWFSPHVGSYVGGDITAGLLCADGAFEGEPLWLYIDIGTNGEVVLGNGEFLLGCACSAGPAFEGGGISCGMRAAAGAIDGFSLEPATGRPRWHTLDGSLPVGICGSGMIDFVSNGLLAGVLDAAGRFDPRHPSPALRSENGRLVFEVVPAGESGTGEPIVVTEADVANVLRAKGAIYAGCALLLEQVGVGYEDLAGIFIAGDFGRHLDVEQAVVLGLLPDIPGERFTFLGNASLDGSARILVSEEYRRHQLSLARRMTYVDLGGEPAYMNQYTAALFLPHTDLERFPRVAARLREQTPRAR